MKLISSIHISHFRSIRDEQVDGIGHFSAFAGLNNSGKSNVLRALHAFFTGNTDAGEALNYQQDYHRQEIKSHKRSKSIAVTVHFDLPTAFKFRKGLEAVEQLLGRGFSITKSWSRDAQAPQYHLGDPNAMALTLDDRAKVDQFLGLINFRYIPNRVLPLDIIRKEHRAIRDVLIRRLAKTAKGQESVFDAIKATSASMISVLEASVKAAARDVGSIRLATPASWQDLIFAFGYKLSTQGVEIDDSAQGSGIQSLLMLQTLSLIDRDFFQKFGWRQAAIWAVEEPESSLHTSLEARIASYLGEIAREDSSRLQILCTTHSDLMLQNADHVVFVGMQNGRSSFRLTDRKAVLEEAANLGISRFSHPILAEPLRPLVLVEGKYDHVFLDRAIRIIAPNSRVRVAYLELLEGGDSTGGDDATYKYLKANAQAVKIRLPSAPVLMVYDWDAKKKCDALLKMFAQNDPLKVLIWPDTSFNPKCGACFRGIERSMSDRILGAANAACNVMGNKTDGTYTVASGDYGKLKDAAFNVVSNGITEADLVHARGFVEQIIQVAQGTAAQP
jgi:predicted ATPase